MALLANHLQRLRQFFQEPSELAAFCGRTFVARPHINLAVVGQLAPEDRYGLEKKKERLEGSFLAPYETIELEINLQSLLFQECVLFIFFSILFNENSALNVKE